VIKNLEDLHNLIFNEWKIPFCELENVDLISDSNSTLLNYAKNFGSSIPKTNHQDHLEITKNLTDSELTNFISENSGNWNIAIRKKPDEIYTNEHWVYTESDISDYRKLNFGIEECLISFSLQEIYFAFCENNLKVESELNFKPIWIDKKYSTNEKTHSFSYDAEFKALKFTHNENNFEEIAFIR
jgi:hypothetical protein